MKSLLLFTILLTSLNVCTQVNATLDFEGETRTYTYYSPLIVPPSPPMLVLVLHGATQDGEAIANVSNMHQFVNSNNAIIVYPDGISNTWNVGLNIGGSTANDVGFLDALIDLFITEMGADPTKVFSCGFSNGGYMSYKMACESTHCISAVASVAGVMTQQMFDLCGDPGETSIMHIHGTSDFIVSYNGSSVSGSSVDDVLNHWKNASACSNTSSVEDLPNINLTDFSTVQKTTWSDCAGDAQVILFKVNGGGHQWPGTEALLGGLGTINRDINSSQEIISFFTQSGCETTQNISSMDMDDVSIFPNPFNENLTIQLPNSQSVLVEVFDFYGRKLHYAIGAHSVFINTEKWSSGIYFLKVENHVFKAIKL